MSELEKDQSNVSFKDHIEKIHLKWNYVMFLQYLDNKASTEYSGFESYISEKRKRHDISWFPIRMDEEEENKR